MRRYLHDCYAGFSGWMEGGGDYYARAMGDGHEVYDVGTQIWTAVQLDGTFEETEQEVVGGSNASCWIPGDVSWTYYGSTQTAFAGFAD